MRRRPDPASNRIDCPTRVALNIGPKVLQQGERPKTMDCVGPIARERQGAREAQAKILSSDHVQR